MSIVRCPFTLLERNKEKLFFFLFREKQIGVQEKQIGVQEKQIGVQEMNKNTLIGMRQYQHNNLVWSALAVKLLSVRAYSLLISTCYAGKTASWRQQISV